MVATKSVNVSTFNVQPLFMYIFHLLSNINSNKSTSTQSNPFPLKRERSLSMATVGIHNLQSSSSSHPRIHASLNPPSNFRPQSIYLRRVANKIKVEELMLRQDNAATITTTSTAADCRDNESVAKLLAIVEAVADRANMHSIIGAQRNNWNHLLTNSINSITLIGSLMAGLSSVPVDVATPQISALKIASMLLFGVATGMMVIVNKIQPSQLAEEQRKATLMWKQLERSNQDEGLGILSLKKYKIVLLCKWWWSCLICAPWRYMIEVAYFKPKG